MNSSQRNTSEKFCASFRDCLFLKLYGGRHKFAFGINPTGGVDERKEST